jgi:DNA-binding MarR family transcriptional regulator
MSASNEATKLTNQQIRFLKLLYKFRFVNATTLAGVIGIRSDTAYKVLEALVKLELVVKVYKKEYRIDRKPAYYYLNKAGVTQVRKLLDVKESVVHALYKNDQASNEFIDHCQTVLHVYSLLKPTLPPDTDIFTKTEINRFGQFPKNRPELYIRTPDGKEVIIVIAEDKPLYITCKRLDELIEHSEDEGWDGDYPIIAFILKDDATKNSFLYRSFKQLEGMGLDKDELTILATSLENLTGNNPNIWLNTFNPRKPVELL